MGLLIAAMYFESRTTTIKAMKTTTIKAMNTTTTAKHDDDDENITVAYRDVFLP